MMKKRLLALALCLVLVNSLLPITALANGFTFPVDSVELRCNSNNWSVDDSYRMTEVASDVYELTTSNVISPEQVKFSINGEWYHFFSGNFLGSGVESDALYNGSDAIEFSVSYSFTHCTFRLDLSKFDYNTKKGATFTITTHYFDRNWTSDETHHWHMCLDDGCTKTSDKEEHTDNDRDHKCDYCKASMHTWQFKADGDTLTGSCSKGDIDTVTLTLKADSVTLPNSPFNARLEGKEQFETATGAAISTIRYDYRGSDGVWHKDVNPVAANAKAGEYQAFVQIAGLPGPVESDGVVAMAENQDGANTAELCVHYTAADPAVTAQTGDNRPIELMLVCALAFSALAAAAFILDSKRKYSR